MKKVFFIAAVVVAAAFGVMKAADVNNSSKMSDLQMENVEALGQSEPQTPGTGRMASNTSYTKFCCLPREDQSCSALPKSEAKRS